MYNNEACEQTDGQSDTRKLDLLLYDYVLIARCI